MISSSFGNEITGYKAGLIRVDNVGLNRFDPIGNNTRQEFIIGV